MSLLPRIRSLAKKLSGERRLDLGQARSWPSLEGGLEVEHEHGRQRIRFLSDAILEVRIAPADFRGRPSPALDPEQEWSGPTVLSIDATPTEIIAQTPAIRVRVDLGSGKVSIFTCDGRALQEDVEPPHWVEQRETTAAPRQSLVLTKSLRAGERLFGLGDKARAFDRVGERYINWNTDAYGFDRDDDPLYKTIPFVVGSTGNDLTYGLFIDSYARSNFDFGHGNRDRLEIRQESEELVYYFIHADSPLEVVRLYARLTGRTPMLPRWALGYHQCRYSYRNEQEMREVATELRGRRIPCDTLYFDIHYMDGFRVFTWDREAFPDPGTLVRDLKEDGFTTVAIVDPGIKIDSDYEVYRKGLQHNAFVRNADGSLYEGHVWPGRCHFPDFTRSDVRGWWGAQLHGLLSDGIDGIWCDMNEPAVFVEEMTGKKTPHAQRTMADDVVFDFDGQPMSHRQSHNLYGMQMHRATFEGMRAHRPANRPFTITRAAYAGSQRFGTCWTGDNSGTWEHLRLAIEQCLSLSVSGMGFCGTDVGGFSGHPSPELMARWTQVGALTPLFRNHSAVDTPRQEPWLFGEEVERICREAIELRYRFLPYLYTLLHEMATVGTPIMRPLPLVHPDDPVFRGDEPFGFYFGDSLLAYPVIKRGQRTKKVYLPGDEAWFDFHTGRMLRAGWHEIQTPLDLLPLYVRAGTILPIGPVVQSTADLSDLPLTLQVFPRSGSFESTLYEDAGEGWAFRDGDYFLARLRGCLTDESLLVETAVDGHHQPAWRHWDVVVHDAEKPDAVAVNGSVVPFSSDGGLLRFSMPPGADFRVTYG